ncbi:MAG: acyl-CoA dehydrogenase [Reyranella sp.]|uniref:acyl-CoA dehydrogenase family protein n=1 Tax=Reyranella sp. TaxID=1929291 RepID=UPI0012224F5D|nr:acyl-CoA dehydrogenase family protein [Reyranella sp.]TAJ87929.1 MAG: acyl-CoA dehydrogenase [Reyranella sp.]TBR29207.1 MAG: acyl-CoA dehydrogenase [Reyranella sp.]
MKFSFSSEQEEFRTSLRRFLAERSPTKEVRRLMETDAGFEPAAWRKLNAELGLTAVRIPEAYGGQGFGFGELCIVLEEMGRALLCAPFFSTAVLATGAILNAGTEAEKQALLPGIASGDTIATLAWVEDPAHWDAAATRMTATPSGGTWKLDGHKSYVLDGHTADLIVVLARAAGTSGDAGLSLFTVKGDAKGLERRNLKVMDPTRKLARLDFKGVEATLLGTAGAAAVPFARTLVEATVCLSNEMAGVSERLREDALAYAQMRMQFGRPIASFQSMKHKQADMLVDVELAKSAAYYAAAALDEGDEDIVAVASLAKAAASEAALQTGIHAIQIHGGIGFTWDNDTHLWFKRAKSSEVLLGDAHHHREQMMQHWAA